MKNEDVLLQHYDYIRHLAESKCTSSDDAEDLVSETFLAAYAFLHRGGEIKFPKTWLANTLMHKWNSAMRRKYHQPMIIEYDTLALSVPASEDDFDATEEAAKVRRELIYLSQTTREVLIRHYYNGYSVSEIAEQLGIPEGTVKSRLSAGRIQIKKGFGKMKVQKNYIPGRLNISFGGSSGPDNKNPMRLVENDLIVQNLLILAYEKPVSAIELSEKIAIPTVYIEPILTKLVNGELMVQTDGGKYYTDFIIYKPTDLFERFDAQLKFVDERFKQIWDVMSDIIQRVQTLAYSKTLNPHQLKKLERYTVMHALQSFQLGLSDNQRDIAYPKRKDGGRWMAMGWSFPGGYDFKEYSAAQEYTVWGGHRTIRAREDYHGSISLKLCEFDTSLWDSPCRFSTCGYDTYFKEIYKFLWCVYKGVSMEDGKISNTLIESIEKLIKVGLITRSDGKLSVDIPVMTRDTYKEIEQIVNHGYNRLVEEIGDDYKEYLKNNRLEIPKHLKSVREVHRYLPATTYLVMAAVREAYNKGLHLSDVDYCCPPVVLVYEERKE